jgi:HlyD family secretion protein
MVEPVGTTDQSVADSSGSDTPPPAQPTRSTFGKWRARAIVLILVVAAAYVGFRISQEKTVAAARIDLGTLTLTTQVVPVETARTGQVIAVAVAADQRVTVNQELGVLEVTTINSQGEPVVSRVALTAPRSGVVVDDPVTLGTTLQPGEPFVELYDPTKLTFVTQMKLENLPQIGPGMIATLKPEGLDRTVKASVQRVVPRVGKDNQTGVNADALEVVLVPVDNRDMAGLVPGLRFTGTVDTRTGQPGRNRLVYIGG